MLKSLHWISATTLKGYSMAKKIVETYVSDLSGDELEEPVSLKFAWQGKAYSIDLSADEADTFADVMKSYVEAATPVAQSTRLTKVPSNAKTVRAWAKSQGIEVPLRGRIPKEVTEMYEAR